MQLERYTGDFKDANLRINHKLKLVWHGFAGGSILILTFWSETVTFAR
jgi:hypothetical protein